ncbi:MAG: peptidoglycan editing factor PgeF [Gammaproteobacteria bacterium]
MQSNSFLIPNWPAPAQVRAFVTTRQGGFSGTPYISLNLATHVGDELLNVEANRQYVKNVLQMPEDIYWLEQVRGNTVLALDNLAISTQLPQADGSWASLPNKVCTVQSADCLPVLLCDQQGTCVSALHAGRQGLALGIIEQGVHALPVSPSRLLAWLGPGISGERYEVGEEIRQEFLATDVNTQIAFKPSTRPDHWYVDLYLIARQQLQSLGITAIYGGNLCTYSDPERFFSYRRDGKTGRMATMIWLG